MSGWTLDNPVFANFVFYSGVLAAKVLLMAPLTAYYRMTKKVFSNDEDAKVFGIKELKFNDKDVERIRRAHQNDIENIPLFCISGLLFVLTNPAPSTALVVFRVYTAARILHTLAYFQGWSGWIGRPSIFLVGALTNFYMIGSVIKTFWSY